MWGYVQAANYKCHDNFLGDLLKLGGWDWDQKKQIKLGSLPARIWNSQHRNMSNC